MSKSTFTILPCVALTTALHQAIAPSANILPLDLGNSCSYQIDGGGLTHIEAYNLKMALDNADANADGLCDREEAALGKNPFANEKAASTIAPAILLDEQT